MLKERERRRQQVLLVKAMEARKREDVSLCSQNFDTSYVFDILLNDEYSMKLCAGEANQAVSCFGSLSSKLESYVHKNRGLNSSFTVVLTRTLGAILKCQLGCTDQQGLDFLLLLERFCLLCLNFSRAVSTFWFDDVVGLETFRSSLDIAAICCLNAATFWMVNNGCDIIQEGDSFMMECNWTSNFPELDIFHTLE